MRLQRADSPGPSCVSMKSDLSTELPYQFKDGNPSIEKRWGLTRDHEETASIKRPEILLLVFLGHKIQGEQTLVIRLYWYWWLQVRKHTIVCVCVCVCVCVFSTDTRRGQRLPVLSLYSSIKQSRRWTRRNWPTHWGAVRDSYFEDRGDYYFEGQKRNRENVQKELRAVWDSCLLCSN